MVFFIFFSLRIALTLKPDVINWSDLVHVLLLNLCFHPQKRVYLIKMYSKMRLYVSFKSFLDTNNRTNHISTAANERVGLCVMFYYRIKVIVSVPSDITTAFNHLYTESLSDMPKKDLHFTNRHCILHPFSLSMSKATKEHPELILPAKTLLLLMQLIFKANFCDACTKGKLPQFSRQPILRGAHLISGN